MRLDGGRIKGKLGNLARLFCRFLGFSFGVLRSAFCVSFCLLPSAFCVSSEVPTASREFRGAWVATVNNIDWPSKPGLPVEEQKAELVRIFDTAKSLNLNAILFQVRPACDALYDSPYEPWSEYLTGEMGRAPEPFYDPLTLAIQEAHRRGLELHAWFNPFRARHPTGKSRVSASHVSRQRPNIVRKYGEYQWLDPGEKEAQDYSLAVILDVVRRYDIDAVHLDDYFYPYKESGPFPDEPSWGRYKAGGGVLGRDDWRRQNIDSFVVRLGQAIKRQKPWVRFGISPFGIWRPGNPPSVKGLDAYSELYADSRRWLMEGWVDYSAPQLYWRIAAPAQSFPVLLDWWIAQNPLRRHLWPGLNTTEAATPKWGANEIVNQVRLTRERRPGATGDIHFSMRALQNDEAGVASRLKSLAYAMPALPPPTPWLKGQPPAQPVIHSRPAGAPGSIALDWTTSGGEPAWQWIVSMRTGGKWSVDIWPGQRNSCTYDPRSFSHPLEIFAIRAVDRRGVEGPPGVVQITPGG